MQNEPAPPALTALAALAEASPDGLLMVDASGTIAFLNQRMAAISGYAPGDLEGQPVGILVPDSARRDHLDHLARFMGDPLPRVMGEGRLPHLRRRDGSLVPVEISLRPVGSGTAPIVVAAVRDVSERVAAQQRLRTSEESFRAAFAEAPIGMTIVQVTPDGGRRILRANDTFAQMLGLGLPELIGSDVGTFSLAEDQSADRAAAIAMATGKQATYARRKRYRRADGTTIWVDFRASMVDFPDLPGPTSLAHIVDITAQHHAEELETQRGRITELVSHVITGMLADDPIDKTWQLVVGGVVRAMGAQNAAVCMPDGPGGSFRVVAGTGPVLAAVLDGEVPLDQELLTRLAAQPLSVYARTSDLPDGLDERVAAELGPGCAARLGTDPATAGLLLVARPHEGPPVTREEAGLLGELARQLSVGMELSRARLLRERLALLEDRQRMARDLHDNVIQDVIAIGMQLDVAGSVAALQNRQFVDGLVDQLEEVVRRLRVAVFPLQQAAHGDSFTHSIGTAIADAARVLGHRPDLSLNGPVDDLPVDLGDQVLAVLRESLSNVARHARATATQVTLTLGADGLTLIVEDDGVGVSQTARHGYGISNIVTRAEQLGGRALMRPAASGGTCVEWRVPAPGGLRVLDRPAGGSGLSSL